MLRATFRQLQTFVLVAEMGSFAAAAARQGISPEAVGDQIRGLETKFGHKLFERRPGAKPRLNDRGAALLRKAPGLLESAFDIASLAKSSERVTTVRVGSGNYILDRLLLPNLHSFQAHNPNTFVEFVKLEDKRDAVSKISNGQMDLAYFASSEQVNAPMAEFLGSSRVVLVCSPDYAATIDDSTPLSMLMPPPGSMHERYVLNALSSAGVTEFRTAMRAQYHETLVQLASDGLGVACALAEHVVDELRDGRLVEIDVQLPPLFRHAFRRPRALDEEHLRRFDAFALHHLVEGRPAVPAG